MKSQRIWWGLSPNLEEDQILWNTKSDSTSLYKPLFMTSSVPIQFWRTDSIALLCRLSVLRVELNLRALQVTKWAGSPYDLTLWTSVLFSGDYTPDTLTDNKKSSFRPFLTEEYSQTMNSVDNYLRKKRQTWPFLTEEYSHTKFWLILSLVMVLGWSCM